MKRLVLCVLAALAVAASLSATAPAAQAQGWFGGETQRSVRERDDDAYFEQRKRYYRRDAVARRTATRRSRDVAQEQDDPRSGQNFFQRLFGGARTEDDDSGWRARQDPGAVEIRQKPRRVRRVAPPPAVGASPPPGAPGAGPATPGADPAAAPPAPVAPTTFVAVIGDSIADNLASGLQEGFADAPELQVRRITKPNSGLVRQDYFDFAPAIETALEAGPITYAVFDVGVNDRQPFTDARKDAPLSEDWRRRYAERIDAALAPFKDRKIPIFWVGLAASESRRATADHVALNALAKDRVEAAGGAYVDVWEGFVDEDGEYAEVGPQLDGQPGRLRLPDGVHFTKAGARKLAHYVEQEIRKVFQPRSATPDAVMAAVSPDAGAPQPGPTAEKPRPISSPVVVLTAPGRAANGAPAAATPMTIPARDASEAASRVLVKGEAPDADPGRMDDHRWRRAEPTQPVTLDKAEPVRASAPNAATPPPAPSSSPLTDPAPMASQAAPLQAPARP